MNWNDFWFGFACALVFKFFFFDFIVGFIALQIKLRNERLAYLEKRLKELEEKEK